MVEGSSGLLQALYPQGVLNKVLYEKPCPEVQLLIFYVSFLKKKYSFRIPFHSSPMVEGSSGLLQAFYPQGILKKVLYGEALPWGPTPCLLHTIFDRKGTPFVYHSIHPGPSLGRLKGGVACCRHFTLRGYSIIFTGKPCPEVHVPTFPHTICIGNSMICSDIWHKYL